MAELLRKPRHEDGYIIITDPSGETVYQTQQCVHCGMHFPYIPGSGKTRGFCMSCMGITCGKPECDPCVPMEKAIEAMEARDRFQRQMSRLI